MQRDAFRAAKKKELRKQRKAAAAQKPQIEGMQADSAAAPSQEAAPHFSEESQQDGEPEAPVDVKV